MLDCGSGTATLLWILCQALQIKGMGIEYSKNRVITGSVGTCDLLQRYRDEKGFMYKVANTYSNLLDSTSFPSRVTIVYQYNEAYPKQLMKHLTACYANAPLTLRLMISAKSHKHCGYNKIFADAGLYPLTPSIPCKMISSNAGSTFCIYGRRSCNYADLNANQHRS